MRLNFKSLPPHGKPRSVRVLAARHLIAVTSLCLVACATQPLPEAEMAVSTAAIAQAARAGAAEFAPAELSAARDKQARANVAIAAHDNTTARWLADEALVDARLAEAKAEASRARQSAEALQTSTRVLREEMSRQSK